jgi:hypothetical protein
LALGIPPNELELRIPYRQLAEWAAFERVEGPILLHQRLDFAGALISFVVARTAGAKRARLEDFVPKWDRRPVQQDAEDLRLVMEGLVSQPSPHSS